MAKKVRLHGVFRTVKARAASTANLALATTDAGQTVDGVVLAAGDRLLLKNQTDPLENGVYVVGADTVALTRASDWPVGEDVVGYAVRVYEGTANENTVWAVYAEPAVVGTDAPDFIAHERNGA
jgi:hypothetical protein